MTAPVTVGLTKYAYLKGARNALHAFGLIPDEDHTVRNLALGGTAALPFAGLIGRRASRITPESGPHIANIEELARRAQPGDVLLSADTGRLRDTSLGGTDFAHTSPVLGKRQGVGVLGMPTTERSTQTLEQLLKSAPSVTAPTELFGSDRLVLLRPKTPYTPEQLRAFTARGLRGSAQVFSSTHALQSGLRELFLPKLKAFETPVSACEGPICSSLTAKALEAGVKPSVSGKALEHALPYDFARSDAFDVIGHAATPTAKKITSKASLLARQLGLRTAIGLGSAGALYAATEDPALVAGAGGAALTPILLRRLLGKGSKGRFALPPFLRALALSPNIGAIRKKILTRSIPLALAGGGLSYLAGQRALGDT